MHNAYIHPPIHLPLRTLMILLPISYNRDGVTLQAGLRESQWSDRGFSGIRIVTAM
ncbi:hypothetical protein ccbrp13_06560 [Ktedonobacteria bacterium brp13]|nr:hypothetical protein ccbrp13_06560 [Ktedonobacteria bacterium brp13]